VARQVKHRPIPKTNRGGYSAEGIQSRIIARFALLIRQARATPANSSPATLRGFYARLKGAIPLLIPSNGSEWQASPMYICAPRWQEAFEENQAPASSCAQLMRSLWLTARSRGAQVARHARLGRSRFAAHGASLMSRRCERALFHAIPGVEGTISGPSSTVRARRRGISTTCGAWIKHEVPSTIQPSSFRRTERTFSPKRGRKSKCAA
jgi:hypothetical protein